MELLAGLLPEGISVTVADAGMWETPLPAEEERYIVGARDKRQREFRAGRHCARAALAAAGAGEDVLILVGESRQPVWPPGFTGSISHTDTVCVAIAAARTRYRSLGLDIENAQPLGADLVSLICTAREWRWLSDQPEPLAWAKVVFSIKEAIFKAHYPVYGVFLDFLEADTVLDVDASSFRATVESADGRLALTTAGRFARGDDLVAAFVAIGQSAPATFNPDDGESPGR